MQIPPQHKKHPDYWIKEIIDYLLEPDLDHPNTRKYFVSEEKKTNKNQQTSHQLPSITNIHQHRFYRFHQLFQKMERIDSIFPIRTPYRSLQGAHQ